MTGALFTIVILTALGLPFATAVAAPRTPVRLAAFAFLFGSGVVAVSLLLLSSAGIPWSRAPFAVTAILVSASGLVIPRDRPVDPPASRGTTLVSAASALAAAAVTIAHGRFATRAPLTEWDFLAIWGLKARTFLAASGIDWAFLERADNRFCNPDYPPVLPLLLDAHALLRGAWDERWIGLLFTAFGVAALAITWTSVRRSTAGPVVLAAAALLFLFPAFSDRLGLAEAPMIAFSAAAAVLVRQGLVNESRAQLAAGGLLLGCAALTKNEGLAFMVSVIVAAIIFRPRWRLLIALAPGVALGVWWQLMRASHDLPTARAAGPVTERVAANLSSIPQWSPALWTELEQPLFWIALAGLAVIAGGRALWRERFLGVTVVLQGLAIMAAYLVSHVDLRSELVYSWERLTHQAALLVALYVMHAVVSRANEKGGPKPASSTSIDV